MTKEVEVPPVLTNKGFSIENKIGSGEFSEVFRAKWKEMPNKDLAVKVIDLKNSNKVWVEKNLKNEMKIIRLLKHPNVVRVYELIKTPTHAYIFMDLAANGNVGKVLELNNRPLAESKARKWFQDVISGMAYIHSRGVAHRDIKPENVLIDYNNNILISDFGFAVIDVSNSGEKLMRGTSCGTPEYMAIEMKIKKEGEVYDAMAADMYSLGIFMYFVVNYKYPFNTTNPIDCIRQQKTRNYRHKVQSLSKNLKDLIYSLLNPNPELRLTANAVLKHKWFTTN